MLKKIAKFCVQAFAAAKNTVKNFFIGCYRHTETIAILVLASLGANALIGELPFLMTLPMWIESPMVIPVLAVLAISLLVKSAEWRAQRRMTHATA